MTVLWSGFAVLIVFAALLIFWPWLGRRIADPKLDSQNLNIRLTRQRLNELQREVQEGLIGKEDQQQAEQELKLALAQEQSSEQRSGKSFSVLVLTIGLLLALAVAGGSYWKANEIGDLRHWQQAKSEIGELGKRVVVDADPSVTAQELQRFALALRTRLWREPDAPEGWLLLGRLHASLNRLDSAIQAYEKSLDLDPTRDSAKMSLAQALVMTASETNLQRASGILRKLTEKDKSNHSAMGLLAITATQLGQNDLALDSWRELQSQLPESDPMYASVAERIAALNGSESAVTELQLKISVAPELTSKLPEQGYLVVFARDPQKGNMPAAVIRQPLDTMPLTLTLTDANAMMADYRLSDLNQAQLIARISQDADVSSQAGELEGEVSITIQAGTIMQQSIVINREIK
ncbi:c-type cytochrome biogenesis protein CcmI [Lacimicrobium alkaliphilum]|uniref:C-type cytochrome biogenesis protein CcmI n=1 Tax=Lacimicrobium alkaliphilum TaxID=1526571 RepID=A0ABQ1RNA1_9ALTE|nr:c-type cytochrome biogenesis protein CcmI [Lacimicrobium alkaliphilum]GGD72705.1 c-type cytochrome biogenesis protein CcmI [Lacimicrobium alkaliphilum]